jgi:hypothetical protein
VQASRRQPSCGGFVVTTVFAAAALAASMNSTRRMSSGIALSVVVAFNIAAGFLLLRYYTRKHMHETGSEFKLCDLSKHCARSEHSNTDVDGGGSKLQAVVVFDRSVESEQLPANLHKI